MTVLDLLTRSAQELNIFDAGTALSSDDAQFIFDLANDYLDGLKTEGLSIAQVTRQTFAITGASSYPVGLGAAINIDRPVSPESIVSIGYVTTTTTPNTEILTGAPMTIQDYASIPQKTMTGTYPVQWYYNPTVPTGSLIPWPIPPSGLTGVIYAPTPLAEFTSLSQTLVLAPGARRFFRLNFATEIADAYEKPASPDLKERARIARDNFKRTNFRLDDLSYGLGGRYDINSDSYVR